MRFRKGTRVVQLFDSDEGRFASPHAWTVSRVSRGVVYIGDAHGESRWTYDRDGRQREAEPGFRSEIVPIKD